MPDQTRSLHERDAETDALLAASRRAAEGRGSAVLVSGTPGIGKSTLLDALVASVGDFRTLRAAAHELEGTIPYGVVRQLFEREYAANATREGASGLAAGILEPAEPSIAAEAGTALHGLYWFVDELARERPLLLVVDDVQWCDEASLLALGYIARRLDDLPVLLVVAARAEAVLAPPTPAVAALLDPAWEEVGSSGRLWTREEMLDAIAPLEPRVTLEPVSCTTVAPGVVLLVWRSLGDSGDATLRSSLWVRSGERWLQRFHQATPEG